MHIPGAEVPCRDATGAGDAFLSGLLHGIAPEDALRLGKIAGANAATRIGCLTAAMNRREMLPR